MDEGPIIIAGMLTGRKYYCSLCGKEVRGFNDRFSAKEYKITGACQQCQNEIFKEDNEESQDNAIFKFHSD
jgi:ribosome-binding protein aMBF1 (putative translation factor)